MTTIKYCLLCLIVIGLTLSYFLNYTPLIIPAVFLFMSGLSFIFYARDKSAARKNQWRVSEITLQLFSLLGGWPGAITAQQVLRHKTIKVSFQIDFWVVTLANIGILVWLHTDDGVAILHEFIDSLNNFVHREFGLNKFSNGFLYLLQYRSVF